MKYAFIIATNAYIVPQGVISYAGAEGEKEILRIRSYWHDSAPNSFLGIDLDIKDNYGHEIKVADNKAANAGLFTIKAERDSVKVLKNDGTLVIHVHQLEDGVAMGLEHNITAELEVNAPFVAIRITGGFMAGNLNIAAENERLYINDNAYATSALAGESLLFSEGGVTI